MFRMFADSRRLASYPVRSVLTLNVFEKKSGPISRRRRIYSRVEHESRAAVSLLRPKFCRSFQNAQREVLVRGWLTDPSIARVAIR